MAKSDILSTHDSIQAITEVSVKGFKSIESDQKIELKPLTILAGANSSGKSSMMQPLMLLKQTLESSYDPGPLLLNGASVTFTEVEQFLCKSAGKDAKGRFRFGISCGDGSQSRTCWLQYRAGKNLSVELQYAELERQKHRTRYKTEEYEVSVSELQELWSAKLLLPEEAKLILQIARQRCFFSCQLIVKGQTGEEQRTSLILPFENFERAISHIIHVPGLRGNPKRNYPVTAVGERFVGTFEDYVASVISSAQSRGDDEFLNQIGNDLRELSLTWKVRAERVDATQVELRVGRLPQPKSGGGEDLVSVADVGFGVSQTLPVVVALVTAKPNQLVYIEQPEIHLHPRAQRALAGLLARAANRGVRVVVETHSAILLLGIQARVAEEKLDPASVILHWFSRGDDGITSIHTGQLDEAGRFGDWPVDFGDVSLEAESEFLDAAEAKLAQGTK